MIGFTAELKEKERQKAVNLLKRLASDTGGRVFLPKTVQELDLISDEIINDIRTQYTIGYTPANGTATKGFHKVQVSIADDPKEQRIAVTRLGYAAVRQK